MKILKKYFKVVMCFMAFALCSFLMVFAPTITVLAAESSITNYAKSINSVQMPKVVDVEKNESLTIPLLEDGSFADSYTIKVLDPAGYIHTCELNNDGSIVTGKDDNGYFSKGDNGIVVSALTNGNYKIVYSVKEGTKEYYSNTYTVNVKNVSYEIDFTQADNSIALVAPEVGVSTSTEDRILVPIPSAKIVGSDNAGVALDPATEISVTRNGDTVPLSTDASTDFVKDGDNYYIQPSQKGV